MTAPLPTPLRRPASAPHFHPLFKIFQIPLPFRGGREVIKVYSPPLKRGESKLWYLNYYPPGCTHPCFLAVKKYPALWNPGSEDSASHVLTFSSYSINILPNYLIFWIWPTVLSLETCFWLYEIQTQKPLNICCFWFSLQYQVCFRICNSEVIFFVLACYCLQLITQKAIAVISGIYLTVINWVHSYYVFEKDWIFHAFSISLKYFCLVLFR